MVTAILLGYKKEGVSVIGTPSSPSELNKVFRSITVQDGYDKIELVTTNEGLVKNKRFNSGVVIQAVVEEPVFEEVVVDKKKK